MDGMSELKQAIARLGARGYVPGSSATKGYVYNPIPFPGCGDIPCHRPNSNERWAIIRKHTNLESKHILDYGCATGYFSFKAIQAGAASVVGVDHDAAAIEVCRAVAKCYNVQNAAFLHTDEFVFGDGYDVTFALSVLNWLGEESATRFCEWVAGNSRVTWIEIPPKGDGRSGAHWLTSDGAIAGWLLRYFTDVIACGSTRGPHRGKMRTLFKCS